MANEIDLIKQRYSRVTLLALVRRADAGWQNVHTSFVYGSQLTANTTFSFRTAIGSVSRACYQAHRIVLDVPSAEALVNSASAGEADFGMAGISVSYRSDYVIEGFLPRTQHNQKAETSLGVRSCWRTRRAPNQRELGDWTFDEEHLARIACDLPKFYDPDFAMLNLQGSLDRLGTIDELFPIPVEVHLRPDPGGLRYEICDEERWLGMFPSGDLIIEAYDHGERVATQCVSLNGPTGLISLPTTSAINASFLAGSMLLDGCGGTFLRSVAINIGIMEADAIVQVGPTNVRIPVAPRVTGQTRTGTPGPARDAFVARLLAEQWRNELASSAMLSERVFEGSDGGACRAEGIELLSAIAMLVSVDTPIVKVVDKYALDPEALMAVAPFAAGIPGAEIWLLTKNESPSQRGRQGMLAWWGGFLDRFVSLLFFWKPTSESDEVTKFRNTASHIARQFHVKIKWFEPTIPLHDRFLQIGERIWHVGHSFNRFGCDLSAIVEFHDLLEADKLKRLLDREFDRPAKETFG